MNIDDFYRIVHSKTKGQMDALLNALLATRFQRFNSLAPGRCEINVRYMIYKLILLIGGWGV